MASEPSQSLFQPVPINVVGYENLVLGTYITQKDKPLENAQNYRVKELRLYKCKSHPFHEYVVAHVESPRTKTAYLRLERNRDHKPRNATEEIFLSRLRNTDLVDAYKEALNEGKESSGQNENETPPLSPVSSRRALGRSSQSLLSVSSSPTSQYSESIKNSINLIGNPADDTVIAISKDSFKKDEELVTLRPVDLDLARLACLARVVHEEDPIYNVFNSQCYWYANLIIKVVQRDSRLIRNGPQLKDEARKVYLSRLVGSRRGTWWLIPVGKVEDKLVEIIYAAFQTQWQKRLSQFSNPGSITTHDRSNQSQREETNPVATKTRASGEDERLRADLQSRRSEASPAADIERSGKSSIEVNLDLLRENESLKKELEKLRRQPSQGHQDSVDGDPGDLTELATRRP